MLDKTKKKTKQIFSAPPELVLLKAELRHATIERFQKLHMIVLSPSRQRGWGFGAKSVFKTNHLPPSLAKF